MDSAYVDAIEMQLRWLLFSRSPEGEQMWRGNEPTLKQSPSQRYSWFGARKAYETPLAKGDLYYIAPAFCSLVATAAVQLPESTFRVNMLPSRCGFVVFANEVEVGAIGDMPDVPLSFRALGWETADRGTDVFGNVTENVVQFVTYSDVETTPTGVRQIKAFWPLSYFHMSDGDNIAERIREFEQMSNMHDDAAPYVSGGDRHEIRYLQALFLMLDQRLLATEKRHVDRAQRRRMEKAKWKPYDNIQVITLRRYAQRPTEAADVAIVNWSCRWIVHGFWRNQYYPSTGDHKPKWIMPFIKGPQGLAVKEQKVIYSAHR